MRSLLKTALAFVVATVTMILPARAAEPTAAEILRRYDQIMGPVNFEGVSQMTAHRDDGSERTWEHLEEPTTVRREAVPGQKYEER